jgi:Tol biopolymer transport system component
VLLGAMLVGGGHPQPRLSTRPPSTRPSERLFVTDSRLGALAYATGGSIFLVGTEREHPDAVVIATNGTDGMSYLRPRWSPDGRYLLYEGAPIGPGPSRIFVADPFGRRVSAFDGWLASWSPDSTRIAAWANPFETAGIWSVDGRRHSTVAFPTGVTLPGDSTPIFSPDGKALYFVLARSSLEPKAVPIDGSAPYALSSISTAGDPAFSNNGRLVALAAADGLYIAQADGSAPRLVSQPAVGRFYDAIWSSTDDRIAVAWTGAAAYESLAVVDAATGRIQIVWETAPGEHLHPIRWAPGGGSILMSSGSQLDQVIVSEDPTLTTSFTAAQLFEDTSQPASTDLDGDWRWISKP